MRLIFVYNADSGLGNAMLDSMHKIVSPQTYDCQLCALTFGVFTEKEQWKNFRESSEIPMEFLHKDEFQKQYKSKWLPPFDYPIVLTADEHQLSLFIDRDTLNGLSTAEELITMINSRLTLG